MKKIISSQEKKKILEWIFENERFFRKNLFGDNRKFLNLYQDKFIQLNLIDEIKKRILDNENILNYKNDRNLISFITEGGYVQKHTDPTLAGYKHIRYNLFLSKPYSGGDPIYDGVTMQYEEEYYLTYRVDNTPHWSLPVVGKKPRITISYGILLPDISYGENMTH